MVLVVSALFFSAVSLLGHPQTPLILTQSPKERAALQPRDSLDLIYPIGTRLVLLKPPYAPDHAQVLSHGLSAAGSPVVSYDGQQVFFAAKQTPESDWQIFQCGLESSRPHQLTSVSGGARHPALLPDGSVVFASPVPGVAGRLPSQLYAQAHGGRPHQLTFAQGGAYSPTMLTDGRILFVSPMAGAGPSLFTINNDGTEITAFAAQHDPFALLGNPRQLPDKRVVFLASDPNRPLETHAEFVSMARPFASRSELLPGNPLVTSVAPFGPSNVLVCAQAPTGAPGLRSSSSCFNLASGSTNLGPAFITLPGWDCLEAIAASAPQRPMGRLSNMDPAKRTGQLLCLDINDTTLKPSHGPAPKASRVRITMGNGSGGARVLGEVPVQEDGSFMAEVPADVLLGFEALDAQRQVLRRESPSIWLRPGENRSCVGCHATHNRAPHNHRPLAVRVPVPKLSEPAPQTLVSHSR